MLNAILLQVQILLSLGLGLAALWIWHARFVQRPKRLRRAPIKTDLLRPAGHTLAENLDELWTDILLPVCAVLCACMAIVQGLRGCFLMIQAAVQLRGKGDVDPSSIWAIPGAAFAYVGSGLLLVGGLIAFFWGFRKLRAILRQVYTFRMGLRGEQAVAEQLQHAVRNGYHVFHDLPKDDGANIDHVVVGRSGVYAIETKARSKDADKTKSDEERVFFDGSRITFGKSAPSMAPVQQAEGNARWLGKMLSGSTGTPVSVLAVIAVPGWWCEPNAFPNIRVRNPEYFAKELVNAPSVLAQDQIERIVHQLDQKCRDVRF